MTWRKSKQESSNRLRDVRRINKYCSTLLLAWQVLALMQNGFSNFDLKRIKPIKPQALMPGAKLRSDNVTALPSVLLQISSQDVLLELATKGVCNKSYVFLLSHVICHSCPGTYMRLEIPRASKAWTCADLHWLENMGSNLAMSRKIQRLRNADQIWSSATIQIYQIYWYI